MNAQTLRERNTRKPNKTNSSPFRGITKCTCGRSFYFKNREKPLWECSGKYSTVNPCSNPTFLDSDYHRAWNRMCKKLKDYADEVILPCLDLFELSEECLISDEILQLREKAEELSNRKYVLCSLCSQGCITTEKLLTLQNEIDAELEDIEKKLSLIDGQGDETIDELTSLYRLIAGTTSERMTKMILKSVISDGKTVEFELLGGLKIKEAL